MQSRLGQTRLLTLFVTTISVWTASYADETDEPLAGRQGALVALMGWNCPLTPLENRFRVAAGDSPYGSGFIDRYIVPIVYPAGLTRTLQIALGCAAIGINLVFYWMAWKRRFRAEKRED